MKRKFFFVVLSLSAWIIFACASAPEVAPSAENTEAPLPTQAAFAPTLSVLPTAQPTQIPAPPAIPEMRRLTLEFPPKMKAGVAGDVIRLTLEVDELGVITPTAQIEGHVIAGETIQIPDLYETHNVTAEARIDLAGMTVQPSEAIFEPLKRGQSATFYWSIRPQETGIYRGTVWLHLNFENKTTKEKDRLAVSAQIIEIEAVDFFGLSVGAIRMSGMIGSVVGGVLGFPFIEDIVKFLFRRKKQAG